MRAGVQHAGGGLQPFEDLRESGRTEVVDRPDLGVDEQAVPSQNHGRVDAIAQSNCTNEVPDARHARSQTESAAKLKDEVSEVKR